jgi:hypothetical protein
MVLLYVGRTKNPEKRYKEHAATKTWWNLVAHCVEQDFPDLALLKKAEAAAIQIETPKYNVQIPTGGTFFAGNRGRLWPEASNFGNYEPDYGHLIEMTLEQQLYPCLECHARAIYCEGDTVACRSCESQWSFDSWFTMTFVDTHEENEDGQLTLM